MTLESLSMEARRGAPDSEANSIWMEERLTTTAGVGGAPTMSVGELQN